MEPEKRKWTKKIMTVEQGSFEIWAIVDVMGLRLQFKGELMP
jgi:hypothetical protein